MMTVDPALPVKVRILAPILRRLRPAWLATLVKSKIGVQRVLVQTDAGVFRVDPISHLGHALIKFGSYVPDMMQILRRFLRPGATFVDLGANEGYYTVLAGRLVGPDGIAIAIEPQSRLLPIIKDNVALNDLQNVKLVQAAVSDYDGSAQLYLAPDVNSGSSGLERTTRYRLNTESTRVTTLSRVL